MYPLDAYMYPLTPVYYVPRKDILNILFLRWPNTEYSRNDWLSKWTISNGPCRVWSASDVDHFWSAWNGPFQDGKFCGGLFGHFGLQIKPANLEHNNKNLIFLGLLGQRDRDRDREKVSLHTFLAPSTKMLLLKPSMVIIVSWNVIVVGSEIAVTVRGKVVRIWIYFVPVHFLFSCPFIQYMRVVSSGWHIVKFLC